MYNTCMAYEIVFYNFKNDSLIKNEIEMQTPNGIKITHINTPIELTVHLRENNNIYLILNIEDEKEAADILPVLTRIKKKINNKDILPSAIVKLRTKSLVKSLQDYGCPRIFEANTRVEIILKDIEDYNSTFSLGGEIHTPNFQSKDKSETEFENAHKQNGFKEIQLDTGEMSVELSSPDGQKFQAKLEHFDNSCVEIETSQVNGLSIDDDFKINIIFKYKKCKIDIELSGKIKDIQSTSEDTTYLTLVTPPDEELFLEEFFELYQSRQKSINDFMQLAKGY